MEDEGLKPDEPVSNSSTLTPRMCGVDELLPASEPISWSFKQEEYSRHHGTVVRVRDNALEVTEHRGLLINDIITAISFCELLRYQVWDRADFLSSLFSNQAITPDNSSISLLGLDIDVFHSKILTLF